MKNTEAIAQEILSELPGAPAQDHNIQVIVNTIARLWSTSPNEARTLESALKAYLSEMAQEFKQGDSVTVRLTNVDLEGNETSARIHKGIYLYPVTSEGVDADDRKAGLVDELEIHRIETYTGAGIVDVCRDDIITCPGETSHEH